MADESGRAIGSGPRSRMGTEFLWPPEVVKLVDWDNGAGVALPCQGSQHRVVRREGRVVALDHSDIERQAAAAKAGLARGEIQRLGFRYVESSFNIDAMKIGRPRPTWIPTHPRTRSFSHGQVPEPDALAPCVRLTAEGFVPCSWCGRLLAEGNVCTVDDDPFCVLANGNGWRRLIPPGWVHSKFVGIPTGFGRGWPNSTPGNGIAR
jgi:hypothetical protein